MDGRRMLALPSPEKRSPGEETTDEHNSTLKARSQHLILHLCLACLVSMMALVSDGTGPVFAATDDPILQKLEGMSAQLKAAEASRLATDQKLLALKGCLKQAVRAPPGSAQVFNEKATRLLLGSAILAARACVVGNWQCQIDGLHAELSDLDKQQEALARRIVDLLSELAKNSEKQAEQLASRLDACVE